MRIYKLAYQHSHRGTCVSYHRHRLAAVEAFKEAKQGADGDSINGEPVISPFDYIHTPDGVIDLLNNRTPSTDNG